MKRLVAALAITGMLAAGCARTPSESLTIGLTYIPNIQFAPFYVAEAKGYFTDEGVDVTLRHHGANESLMGAIAAGDEQLVIAGADEMLQAASAGTDVVTVGQLYQEYPVVLIVPEDSDIREPADLKGHSVGVPGPFGENWFGLLAFLQGAGLTENDVTIEHIGYTLHSALTTSQVDSVFGFANNDFVGFTAADFPVRKLEIPDLPLKGIGIGASGETVKNSPKAITGVVRAIQHALADIIADPRAATELCFEHVPELAVAGTVDSALVTLNATIPLYGDGSLKIEAEKWPEMYDFMVKAGLAEPGFDPSQAVVATLVP